MKTLAVWLIIPALVLPTIASRAESGASASPATPLQRDRLTLADTVAEALRANPGLKSLVHRTEAARRDAAATTGARWGELNLIGNYSRLNDDQIVRSMSSELLVGGMPGLPFDRDQLHYGAVYDLPLYLGGRLVNQIKIARLEAQKPAPSAPRRATRLSQVANPNETHEKDSNPRHRLCQMSEAHRGVR